MEKLSAEQITKALENLNHDLQEPWNVSGEMLSKTFQFEDFSTAFAFVKKVADLAENEAHHPKITIDYAEVAFELTTHDAGGLTTKDFTLAQHIETV